MKHLEQWVKVFEIKNKERTSQYQSKVIHGYVAKAIQNDPNNDDKTSKSRTRNKDMASKFKTYAFAIKDQEISTKYMRAEQQIGNASNATTNARYRLCKATNEDVIYVIATSPMSVCYYLPICHNFITKTVLNSFIPKQNPSYWRKDLESSEYIQKEGNL